MFLQGGLLELLDFCRLLRSHLFNQLLNGDAEWVDQSE